MKTLRSFVSLATAVLLAASAPAADLTVNQGDSQTISADTTYGAVVVNGNLTVAPNVTLKCSSLTVSDNIGAGNTARLLVGDGAKVEVNGDYYTSTKIGVKAGRAEVRLGTGATFTVAYGFFNICWGYDGATSSPMTEALLVVGTNATVSCKQDFCFGHKDNKRNYQPSSVNENTVCSHVILEPGAKISCQRIDPWQEAAQEIVFNGGRIVHVPGTDKSAFIPCEYNAGAHTLILKGTNGCPVHLELNARNNLISLYDNGGKNGSRVRITGDGGFLKTGAGDFPIDSTRVNSEPVRFQCTGDVVIREGGLSVAQNNTAHNDLFQSTSTNPDYRPVDLVVECGAKFDLAGSDVCFNSIKALGIVTNSASATKTMTLGVLDNGCGSTMARVFPGIALVKQGSAALSLCASEIDSLNVQGGTVVIKDRAHTGYPLYRFKFDRSGLDDNTSINNAMYVREIAFLMSGEDETSHYSKLHYDKSGTSFINDPENLVDGNINTEYHDYRMHKAIGDGDREKVQISLEYDTCKVFDEYRLAPFYSQEFQWQLNPTAWRVFGGFSPDGGDLLDQVTGFYVSGTTAEGWATTNFVLTCPVPSTLHVGTLALANGTTVEATGAQVSCDTFSGSATGVELDLSSGATLPLTANQSVSEITVDLTKDLATVAVLNPEASGTLNVTGDRRSVKGALLYAGSCSNASRLSSWTVYLNGTRLGNGLCYDNGAVRLLPLATVVYLR